MRFRNISTSGALDLPLLGRIINAGEEFDIPANLGELLTQQPAVWEWLDRPEGEVSYRDLQAEARDLGLPAGGTKADLSDRIALTVTDGDNS